MPTAAPIPFARFLRAGLLAGVAAALLNVVIYLIIIAAGGHSWDILTLVSIMVASFLPNLLAALAYFGLQRVTAHARAILTAGIILFIAISVLPHFGIGPPPSPALAALPEGFDVVTVPLHFVFGATAVFLMPYFVSRPR